MLTASNDRPTCLLHRGWRIEVVFEPAANGGMEGLQTTHARMTPLDARIKGRRRRLRKITVIMAPLSVGESERVSCVVVTSHGHCHDGG